MLKRLYDATLGSFRTMVQTLFAVIGGVVFALVIVPMGLSGGIKRCVLYGAVLAGFLYYLYCYITKRGEKITDFIEALTLTLIVYLFVSARVGMFILITMIIAPILSTISALISATHTDVDIVIDKELINKGESAIATVTVTNRSFLPGAPIIFKLKNSAHLASVGKDTYTVFVMPHSTETFNIELSGKICGMARVCIDLIDVRNHLGTKLFEKQVGDELFDTIAIVPEIPKVTEQTELVQKVINTANTSDESEDTVEGVGNVFSGFPGYENREYVPGDPLKRINWKQSAKRGRLLVHKEDEAELSTVYVWLDRCFSLLSDTEESVLCAQSCIEGSLAIALSLVKTGCHVEYLCWDDEWLTYRLNTEDKLKELTQWLASYKFEKKIDDNDRFPPEIAESKESKSILLCTPFTDMTINNSNIAVYSVVERDSELYGRLREVNDNEQNR